jgi:hypothetical protein
LKNNERAKDYCHRCGITLPPPGQRYLENCPRCGLPVSICARDGTRVSNNCPDCRAPLPLLEPAKSYVTPCNLLIENQKSKIKNSV